MFKKSKIALISTSLIALLALAGCGQGASSSDTNTDGSKDSVQSNVTIDKKVISLAGSTAIQPLADAAGKEFMAKYPEVQVNLSGGGSGTGMNNVASGAVDIGNSDVDVPDELKDKGLVDHKVAVAPFLIIINKDVTVDNLSKQQLTDIFTGKITNWKEVGGKDEKISIIGRAASSGTRKTINKIVMDGAPFTDAATAQDSTGNLLTGVAATPGSIGYIDAAYLNDTVKAIKYDGVEYTAANVINGTYKIWSYEHMYTKGEATGTIKAFIDFMLSDDVQTKIVEQKGFIPMSKMK